MMNRQSDHIERLFQAARQSEPDLGDWNFTDAVMQGVSKSASAPAIPVRKQRAVLWLTTVIAVCLVASLFPVSQFAALLGVFTSGVTLPQIGIATLIVSVLSFSAYWVVEADGLVS